MGDLVTEVAEALAEDDGDKGVFTCVGGRPSYEFRNYDYSGLVKADNSFLFIMAYDMHFWDDYTCVLKGECSPAEAPYPDVKDGVKEYAQKISPDKLVLGLPWYGQRYTYVTLLPINEGQIDYQDVLKVIDNGKVKSKTKVQKDQSWKIACHGACEDGKKGGAIWYDDAETLAPKYKLASDNNLMGVGVWEVDKLPYDDDKHDKEVKAMWSALSDWKAAATATKSIVV